MGYYTRYRLSFETECDDAADRFKLIDAAVADLELIAVDASLAREFGFQYDWDAAALYDIYVGNADTMTFYEHEKPVREFSKRHPDIIVVLEGEGEEAGDLWKKYFKNGKMQECRAEITYPDYDPEQLV